MDRKEYQPDIDTISDEIIHERRNETPDSLRSSVDDSNDYQEENQKIHNEYPDKGTFNQLDMTDTNV